MVVGGASHDWVPANQEETAGPSLEQIDGNYD